MVYLVVVRGTTKGHCARVARPFRVKRTVDPIPAVVVLYWWGANNRLDEILRDGAASYSLTDPIKRAKLSIVRRRAVALIHDIGI